MSRPPKVIVVTSRLDVGGAERHLAQILPLLHQRGIDITAYVMERGGSLEGDLAAGSVRIEGPQRMRVLHWPRAALALAAFLRREAPDIVHFFLPRPYLYGSIAAEIAGCGRRVMSRRSLTDYHARYPLLGWVESVLHRRTGALLGNSQAVMAQLAAETDDRRKLVLIHNGVDIPAPPGAAARQRLRETLGIPADTMVFTVVANLIAYKGYHELLHALALSKGDLPEPWRLVAVGRDDGIGSALRQTAETLGLAANVIWLGERNDVAALLGASDIFVLPSHQEGFSNALLEAMASSLPVVATAVGGNIDAVMDGESGLLTAPRDTGRLASAILHLARDQALRQRLGEAARRRVDQEFTMAACVAKYEKLYRGLSETVPVDQIFAADRIPGAMAPHAR